MAQKPLTWYSTAIEALRGVSLVGKTALVTGGEQAMLEQVSSSLAERSVCAYEPSLQGTATHTTVDKCRGP